MTKEVEKYIIAVPSPDPRSDPNRYKHIHQDIENASIEKVFVGDPIFTNLTDYKLDKIDKSVKGITTEWWVKK